MTLTNTVMIPSPSRVIFAIFVLQQFSDQHPESASSIRLTMAQLYLVQGNCFNLRYRWQLVVFIFTYFMNWKEDVWIDCRQFFFDLFSAFLFLDCDKASSHCVISVLMFEMSRHLAGLFLSKLLSTLSTCLFFFSPLGHVTKACDVLRSIEEFKHKAGMVRPSPPPLPIPPFLSCN